MTDRWWRAYDRSRRDPKLQRLPAETFRGWFNLVCLASENGGALPALADIAFELRKSEFAAAKLLDDMKAAELFENIDGVWSPRKWNTLQYKSDVSTERVKRFRKRFETVSETPSESEADTEQISVPNGTGTVAPDPVKLLFDEGVKLLTETGSTERAARTIVGKWRKEQGNEAVMAGFREARAAGCTEPISYLTTLFANAGKPRENWNDRRIREGHAAIEKALAETH